MVNEKINVQLIESIKTCSTLDDLISIMLVLNWINFMGPPPEVENERKSEVNKKQDMRFHVKDNIESILKICGLALKSSKEAELQLAISTITLLIKCIL
jgi:hypothetical protein